MSSPSLFTRSCRSFSSVFREPVAFTLSSALFMASTLACMSMTNLSRLDVNGVVLTVWPDLSATRLNWRELSGGPDRWTLLTVPQRLKRLKTDLSAGYWTARQQARASRATLRRL
jgi:hypothetical protein